MLHSREGTALAEVVQLQSPVTSLAIHSGGGHVAMARQDGHLSVHQLTFATVHGMYLDCYAFREAMTGVVVQNMATGGHAAIQCGAPVLKIAVYVRRLAVQLQGKILIYGLPADAAAGDLSLHVIARIERCLECNLMMIAAHHLILCQERELQLLTFQGEMVNKWSVGAPVRYLRMLGGPEGSEGLVAGLKDGGVLYITLDNPKPMLWLKHSLPVRCLDVSASQKMVAVVDDANELHAYELATRKVLWTAEGATSAAWNTQFDDMLCYSGNGFLCTKTADFAVQRQKLQVACLGVTDADWRNFAEAAVHALVLDLAAAAYTRIGDARMLNAVQRLSQRISEGLAVHLAHAAALALLAGDLVAAVEVLAQHGLWGRLLQVAANLDVERPIQSTALRCAAAAFRSGGQSDTARELFNKLGDHKALAQIAVEEDRWEEALMLLKRHPDLCQIVAVPRARHLLANGCHEEAYATYMDAGMVQEASTVMQQLVHTAVTEGRFRDAARHTLQIGLDALAQLEGAPRSSQETIKAVEAFQNHYTQAQIYHGYQLVHQAMTGETSSIVPSTLFHTAHFVFTRLLRLGTAHFPMGVSLVRVLQCLAAQSEALGAHDIAAAAHSSLQQYYFPDAQQVRLAAPLWQPSIHLGFCIFSASYMAILWLPNHP
ncbi:Intraflagellar transport protein 122 homolog [Coccomyxa sp. Obi]|nr:Intraflagellar transport protein 122 homolog [Coccomyxa sp. Obi]